MEMDQALVVQLMVPIVLLIVEYFLGKTAVPKANSIIEVLFSVFSFFKKKD
jgi:hypothetical protein